MKTRLCQQTLRAIDRALVRFTLVHAKNLIPDPPGYRYDVIQATLNEFRQAMRASQGRPTPSTPYADESYEVCPLRVYYAVERHRKRLDRLWA